METLAIAAMHMETLVAAVSTTWKRWRQLQELNGNVSGSCQINMETMAAAALTTCKHLGQVTDEHGYVGGSCLNNMKILGVDA